MPKNYQIGFGKPPKAGQFKKGKSGNPKGRPKGNKNLSTELSEELSEKIIIKENGKTRTVSKQRALIKALLGKGLSGSPQAARVVIDMAIKLLSAQIEEGRAEDWSDEDAKILAEFEQRLSKGLAKKSANNG